MLVKRLFVYLGTNDHLQGLQSIWCKSLQANWPGLLIWGANSGLQRVLSMASLYNGCNLIMIVFRHYFWSIMVTRRLTFKDRNTTVLGGLICRMHLCISLLFRMDFHWMLSKHCFEPNFFSFSFTKMYIELDPITYGP